MYDKKVSRIKRKNGKIFIHEHDPAGVINSLDLLFPFPSEICHNLEQKQALLSHLACSDSLFYFYDLVEYFLAGKSIIFR